jgi:hypothetical protein
MNDFICLSDLKNLSLRRIIEDYLCFIYYCDLHTLAYFSLQLSAVFSPPFILSPFISVATRVHVEDLKLPPSPASDLCLSRNVMRAVSSSCVHVAHSFCGLVYTALAFSSSGLESMPLCLLHVAMYT